MFANLLKFEIKNRLGRLSSLAYFLVYGSLAFLFSISFAGAFRGVSISFGLSNRLALNSPVAISVLTGLLAYFGLLVVAPLFGQSVNKDFEEKFSQILFATPIRRPVYFFVRYLGSAISSVVILSSIGLGIYLATRMPFVDRTLIAKNHLWFYLAPYLTGVVPNILILGAAFFSVITVSKKMAPVYVASVTVFTGWLIANALTKDVENKFLAALIDPLGLHATSLATRYWSVAEQSSRVIPLTGVYLYNRLLWGGVGLLFLAFSYFTFDPFRLPKEKKIRPAPPAPAAKAGPLASVRLLPRSAAVLGKLLLSEFRQALQNVYFLMILLCGVLFLFASSSQVGKVYGTETLPVTYHVVELIGGSFGLFMVILTAFYAGEIVWKDRDSRFYELVDSKPVPTIYLYVSKLAALFLVQLFLSVVVLACCVLIQVFKGYYLFEWPVYFKHLFFYSLAPRLLLCVMALFIQSLVSQKFIGHGLLILLYMAVLWLPSLGFEHRLYQVGQLPWSDYSDMNGFGTSLTAFSVFGAYWAFFHLGLAILTVLLWRRGSETTFSFRWREAKRRLRPAHRIGLGISLAGFAAFGIFIFYQTNVLNHFETTAEREKAQADYELTYKKAFSHLPTPEIVATRIDLDLFPETQSLEVSGVFTYRNKTSQPIRQFLLSLSKEVEPLEIHWSRPAKKVSGEARLQTSVYEFTEPLPPGAEVTLRYRARRRPHGLFSMEDFDKRIVQNGSFINNEDFAPALGYNPTVEITAEKVRHKYALPERARMPPVNDPDGLSRNYATGHGSWINFEATVSTAADQIAMAPGYLQKEWRVGQRRYFHYQMDKPMLNFYAILSARYEVARDTWNGVAIEIYHHPGHTRNIPRMIAGVKASLEYYSQNFSPYQFRQLRILEFPRYETFAQSFPNTIPFSESVGFIARVKEKDPLSIDYPFYVTAHEVAHQWWAHQVIGADVQGSTMLAESLAQYSALMVQEKEYGAAYMKKFLKYELDTYLNGRSTEPKRELPLALNENQQYIHYNKGSLVFYALKDYLGEATVNRVLRDFIAEHAFRGAPFPRAVDLVEKFRKVTPPNLAYLIDDLFTTITFYDNRTQTVSYRKVPAGYEVTVQGTSAKLRAAEDGTEAAIPMDDLIDVGAFDKDGKILYLAKHRLKAGANKIQFITKEAPVKGGIDPLNKLIDKISDDNLIRATEEK